MCIVDGDGGLGNFLLITISQEVKTFNSTAFISACHLVTIVGDSKADDFEGSMKSQTITLMLNFCVLLHVLKFCSPKFTDESGLL